jgi:NADH:ubiquinone oxidoreductase subunit 6 (subunit J)
VTIFWIASTLSVLGSLAATFAGDLRVAILALWITGLAAGGIQLALGAEVLAVCQWVISTLITLNLFFHSVTYGEHGAADPRLRGKRAVAAIFPVLIGAGFGGVLWLGTRHLPIAGVIQPAPGQDLAALGKMLLEKHLLTLEMVAVLLFLAVVGAGVLARPERSGE